MSYSDQQDTYLNEEELALIQKAYYRRRMKDALIGPMISTGLHVLMLLLLSMYKGEVRPTASEVSVVIQEDKKEDELVPIKEPEKQLDQDPPDLSPVEPEDTSPTPVDSKIDNLEVETLEDLESFEAPNPVLDNFTDLKPSTSPNVTNRMHARVSDSARARAVIDGDGSEVAQEALNNGLNWLARNQRPDGSWGANQGVTGLALLAFLAYGETPKSKKYGSHVSLAIQNLAQSDRDSALNKYHAYPHAIKVYALSEAYIITNNYSIVKPLKEFAAIIIKGQKAAGDFDYNYKQGPRWDNSISFWNYQALKALALTGLKIEGLQKAIAKAIPRLEQMAPYHFPYAGTEKKPQGRGNAGLAAAGAWCLQFFGEGKNGDVKKIMDRIAKEGKAGLSWNHAPSNWVMYAWYYQTYAMFQHGGNHWKKWAKEFEKVLMEGQNSDGSWSHEYAWGSGKSIEQKAYQTAMASLMLTVYYRYSAFGKSMKLQEVEDGEEELDIFLR